MLMREYETLYILRPELADDAIVKLNERLTGVLDREGAKILRLDVWGKKKLAYEVKKNPKGVYIHLSYLSNPNVVSEFERNLRMLEPVIKFQTIRIAENVDVENRMAQQEAENRTRAAAEAQKQAEMKERADREAAASEAEPEGDWVAPGKNPAGEESEDDHAADESDWEEEE
jgi:small subunit ribosomal protein S6